MSTILHGKINGRTIELDEDPGLAPGEEVEVRSFLLDTDTCSFHLKRASGLIHRFVQ